MAATLIGQEGPKVTIQFTVELTGNMLHDEQALQQSLNEAGQVAMAPMLKQFDTNGEPIRINGIKHTVRITLLKLTKHLTARSKSNAELTRHPRAAVLTYRLKMMPE